MVMNINDPGFALRSLSVYRGIRERSVIKVLERLLNAGDSDPREFVETYCEFFSLLCERGCADKFSRAVTETLLFDENCFTKAAAAGKASELPRNVLDAAKNDCKTVSMLSGLTSEDVIINYPRHNEILFALPRWICGEPAEEFKQSEILAALEKFHRENGCGMFARYKAFVWRQGGIKPVTHPDNITLDSLKGYDYQRGLIISNTEAFILGKPCNNCLLYGDKGTGKSSTVKAVGNHFRKRGLRVVEIPKERLMDLPLLIEAIAALPMKFIIFIDDFSLLQQDQNYTSLKAVLEGGLAARPDNAVIYATSNRRHIIKECFSDRETDDVNRRDNMEESLSLSDRFGLAVPFMVPRKDKYLEIVLALAEQYGVEKSKEEICAGAERFALERGGRSPRCAKQYIESLFN